MNFNDAYVKMLTESFVSGVNYDSVLAAELKQVVGDLHKIAPYVLEIGNYVESDSKGQIHVINSETRQKKIFKDIPSFLAGIRYKA